MVGQFREKDNRGNLLIVDKVCVCVWIDRLRASDFKGNV